MAYAATDQLRKLPILFYIVGFVGIYKLSAFVNITKKFPYCSKMEFLIDKVKYL